MELSLRQQQLPNELTQRPDEQMNGFSHSSTSTILHITTHRPSELHCSCQFYANMRLPHRNFSKVLISHNFPHKLAFSTAILILFVFLLPMSIRFRYRIFVKQRSETVMIWNQQSADCSLKNKCIASYIIIFGPLSFRIPAKCGDDEFGINVGKPSASH